MSEKQYVVHHHTDLVWRLSEIEANAYSVLPPGVAELARDLIAAQAKIAELEASLTEADSFISALGYRDGPHLPRPQTSEQNEDPTP